MKKSLLITTSLLTLGVVTGIYAQSVGATGSIVDKMKAVAHSFTLSTSLNPGDTGLTSDPVKGKKTGDILTAGEYNRLLELVSEGGGGGGFSNVELVTSQDVGSAAGTSYANRWSEANCPTGKKLISGGCSYPNTRNSFIHNAPKSDLSGWTCGGIAYNGDISSTSTEYPTRPTAYAICGVYGSSTSGSSSWVDVPLTDTNPFDIDNCEYRFRVSGLAGNSTIPGFSQTHWYDATYKSADALANAGWYYFRSNNKQILYGIDSSNNNVWNATTALGAKVAKLEKKCN